MSGVLRAKGKSGHRDRRGRAPRDGDGSDQADAPTSQGMQTWPACPQKLEGKEQTLAPSPRKEGTCRHLALRRPLQTSGTVPFSPESPRLWACYSSHSEQTRPWNEHAHSREIEASLVTCWRGRRSRSSGARTSQGADSSSLPPLHHSGLLLLPFPSFPTFSLCEEPSKGEEPEPQLRSPSPLHRPSAPAVGAGGAPLSGPLAQGRGTTDKWNEDLKNHEPNGWRKSGHQHIGEPGRGPQFWREG